MNSIEQFNCSNKLLYQSTRRWQVKMRTSICTKTSKAFCFFSIATRRISSLEFWTIDNELGFPLFCRYLISHVYVFWLSHDWVCQFIGFITNRQTAQMGNTNKSNKFLTNSNWWLSKRICRKYGNPHFNDRIHWKWY